MATLTELADDGRLERIEVDLEDRLPFRCLFGTPGFVAWLENDLPLIQTGAIGAETTPLEQVDALFFDFISGVHFQEDRRFHPISYNPDLFVWELKTLDVRIFGWFVKMDHFVCCFGDHKENLLRIAGRVERLAAQTSFVRQQLPLNEPKHLVSKEYANVLSDKY